MENCIQISNLAIRVWLAAPGIQWVFSRVVVTYITQGSPLQQSCPAPHVHNAQVEKLSLLPVGTNTGLTSSGPPEASMAPDARARAQKKRCNVDQRSQNKAWAFWAPACAEPLCSLPHLKGQHQQQGGCPSAVAEILQSILWPRPSSVPLTFMHPSWRVNSSSMLYWAQWQPWRHREVGTVGEGRSWQDSAHMCTHS